VIAARPTIAPAQPVSANDRATSSALRTSPLTTTGIETCSRAWRAHCQSASPLCPICAVRQCKKIAATPASSSRRARSQIGICDSGPQPIRVLTVTGRSTAATIARAIATIADGSRSQPAPAPRAAIRGIQQPQLMSRNAGRARAAISAARTSIVGSPP